MCGVFWGESCTWIRPLTETYGGSGAAAAMTTVAVGTEMLHDLGDSDATAQITSWGEVVVVIS